MSKDCISTDPHGRARETMDNLEACPCCPHDMMQHVENDRLPPYPGGSTCPSMGCGCTKTREAVLGPKPRLDLVEIFAPPMEGEDPIELVAISRQQLAKWLFEYDSLTRDLVTARTGVPLESIPNPIRNAAGRALWEEKGPLRENAERKANWHFDRAREEAADRSAKGAK